MSNTSEYIERMWTENKVREYFPAADAVELNLLAREMVDRRERQIELTAEEVKERIEDQAHASGLEEIVSLEEMVETLREENSALEDSNWQLEREKEELIAELNDLRARTVRP